MFKISPCLSRVRVAVCEPYNFDDEPVVLSRLRLQDWLGTWKFLALLAKKSGDDGRINPPDSGGLKGSGGGGRPNGSGDLGGGGGRI